MTNDNGSPINVTERAIAIAEKEEYPDTIEVTTGNSFPYANEMSAMQKINQSLGSRLDYVVLSENDITPGGGFLTVILTKK